MFATLLQLVVVVLSGSIALLADTIHNFGDASTAIPLGIASAERDVVAGGGERAAEGSADAAGAENGDLHAGAVRARGGR